MKRNTSIYPSHTRMLILGGGESGVGAAILAQKAGYPVLVSDSGTLKEVYKTRLLAAGIPFEERGHSPKALAQADVVIKSPGIPNTARVIQEIRQVGKPILSELEFAAKFTDARLIGITGSNGKSTVATLTWYMLKKGGLYVGLAGNIGKSFALQVAEEAYDYYVLEISSFMLEDIQDLKLDIAVLLNITPDHLDRYAYDMDLYADAKMRIFQHQGKRDIGIYCADDVGIQKALTRHQIPGIVYTYSQQKKEIEGAYVDDGQLVINIQNKTPFNMSINELAMQGKHNVYNNMASGIIAKVLELRNETMRESMGEYQNIPHRLEHVARIAGVNFINDSKATNVNAVWYALESVPQDVVLIMGGVDKGNDYSMLQDLVRQKVKALICLGKDNQRIHEAFDSEVEVIVNTRSMAEAVEVSFHLASKGDTVLLSPACASFDLFKNYEDRGDQFKKAVKDL